MEWRPDRAGRQCLRAPNHGCHRAGRVDRVEPKWAAQWAGRPIGDASLMSIQEANALIFHNSGLIPTDLLPEI
jgi:hypothetical protein